MVKTSDEIYNAVVEDVLALDENEFRELVARHEVDIDYLIDEVMRLKKALISLNKRVTELERVVSKHKRFK